MADIPARGYVIVYERGGISSGLFSKPWDSLPVGKLESRSSSNHWFYPVFGAFRALNGHPLVLFWVPEDASVHG